MDFTEVGGRREEVFQGVLPLEYVASKGPTCCL